MLTTREEKLMIKIQINDQSFDLSQTNPSWLTKTINELQRGAIPVCLKVFIKIDGVDIVLSCGSCPVGKGGGRNPNDRELEIFELWEKLGCKGEVVNAGNVVAFLNKFYRY
ncbi:hypothetical protein HC02_06125 [Vibrio parahaemolyticus]|nr:hypothetical protein HC02_06125 [Vibrio parahaemolyticus]